VTQSFNKKNKGFTLIEMLVAVALFSIVLVVAMGAILTVIDANRKAQTLSSVMTNLNFAIESMTRSIKTGVDPELSGSGINQILSVDANDLSSNNFTREKIQFKLSNDSAICGGTFSCIARKKGNDPFLPITAPEVDIKNLEFSLVGESEPPNQSTGEINQPITHIAVQGVVKISNDIESSFKIQTSVSQRRLNIAGEESSI
jgi:prepilin-type N-terminal cleavage/methylation domain-containing protein